MRSCGCRDERVALWSRVWDVHRRCVTRNGHVDRQDPPRERSSSTSPLQPAAQATRPRLAIPPFHPPDAASRPRAPATTDRCNSSAWGSPISRPGPARLASARPARNLRGSLTRRWCRPERSIELSRAKDAVAHPWGIEFDIVVLGLGDDVEQGPPVARSGVRYSAKLTSARARAGRGR